MNRKIYLFILLNVIIVSVVLSLHMVEGKKQDDNEKEQNELYAQYGEYGYFACYDSETNTTMYYDQRVSENCVMIGDGK